MTPRITLVALACTLALAACSRSPSGDETASPAASSTASTPAPSTGTPPPASSTAMPPAASTAMPPASSTAMPPAASTTAAAAAAATPPAGGAKPAAVVKNCATTVEGNDAMQFDVGSITIPASCSKFTINLKHTGKMAVTAMGHDVVISKEADMQGVLADGMGAGAASDYLKPGDTRVIAHTKLIGGGEKTSVTFDASKLKSGGPYEFFCSFPGHAAMMKGTISVG